MTKNVINLNNEKLYEYINKLDDEVEKDLIKTFDKDAIFNYVDLNKLPFDALEELMISVFFANKKDVMDFTFRKGITKTFIENMECLGKNFNIKALKNIKEIKSKILSLKLFFSILNGKIFRINVKEMSINNSLNVKRELEKMLGVETICFENINIKNEKIEISRQTRVNFINSKLKNVEFLTKEDEEGNSYSSLWFDSCDLKNIYFKGLNCCFKECSNIADIKGESNFLCFSDFILKSVDVSQIKTKEINFKIKNIETKLNLTVGEKNVNSVLSGLSKDVKVEVSEGYKTAKNKIVYENKKEDLVSFKSLFIDKNNFLNEKYYNFVVKKINKNLKGILIKKKKEFYISKKNINNLKNLGEKYSKAYSDIKISLEEKKNLFLNQEVVFLNIYEDFSEVNKEEIILDTSKYESLLLKKIECVFNSNVKRVILTASEEKERESLREITIKAENIESLIIERTNLNEITINGNSKHFLLEDKRNEVKSQMGLELHLSKFETIEFKNIKVWKVDFLTSDKNKKAPHLIFKNSKFLNIDIDNCSGTLINSNITFRSVSRVTVDRESFLDVDYFYHPKNKVVVIGKPKNYDLIKEKDCFVFI